MFLESYLSFAGTNWRRLLTALEKRVIRFPEAPTVTIVMLPIKPRVIRSGQLILSKTTKATWLQFGLNPDPYWAWFNVPLSPCPKFSRARMAAVGF
jgi:hypothetical protein